MKELIVQSIDGKKGILKKQQEKRGYVTIDLIDNNLKTTGKTRSVLLKKITVLDILDEHQTITKT